MVFNEVLNNADSQLVVTYLADKYKISAATALAGAPTSDDSQSKAPSSGSGPVGEVNTPADISNETPTISVKAPAADSNEKINKNVIPTSPVIQQAAPVTNAPPVATAVSPTEKVDLQVAPKESACSGAVDPFAGQSIETFSPPRNSGFSDIMKWEDAKKEMMTGVKRMKTGGNKLRDFIHKEVRRMQLLRFETFCKYV